MGEDKDMRMTRWMLLLAAVWLAVFAAGCSGQNGKKSAPEPAAEKAGGFPVELTDGLGEKVKIEKEPERLVSLIPSNTEIAYALGLGDRVAGVSDFDNYPEETKEKEKIGGVEFNTEKIIALKPDLVLAHASTAASVKDGLRQIKESGIDVLIVNDAQSFKEVYKSIAMIGRATGREDEADSIISDMKSSLEAIAEKAAAATEEKTVFAEVEPEPAIYTTGKGTFMDEMLTLIHARNAAGNEEGWAKMSEESIIAMNPDVIITTYGDYVKDAPAQVLKRKGWKSVSAVKNRHVYDVDPDLVTRSGPRLAEGVEELAKAVYPEIFAE